MVAKPYHEGTLGPTMSTATQQKRGSGGFSSGPGPNFGQLEQMFDDVWWAWGTTRFMAGMYFPRTMVIVREGSGLVVMHPVLMPAAEQAKIDALGPIEHIVRLGAFHGMEDAAYLKRYPKATAWAPPGVDLAPGARVDRELRPGQLPFASATLFSFENSAAPENALLLPRHGGLLLTCDSVQNWETTRGCSPLGVLMSKFMGFSGRACVGPAWRKVNEPKDGVGFAREFERLCALEFRHAIGGHGGPMRDTARDDLRATVRRLYGTV
jgi:hypothetical protein